MTTTNVYQGLAADKSSSRVLKAPGGGSSNIFGHYQGEEGEKPASVPQSNGGGMGRNPEVDSTANFMENKDSFAANRERNHGSGAPFATSDSMISGGAPSHRSSAPQRMTQVNEGMSPQQQLNANRARNQGQEAPFAVGNVEMTPSQAGNQQTLGDDYMTPKERQAGNPNKAANSFSNLFGDSEQQSQGGSKVKGQVSTHNPVTWAAYSNYDESQDRPQHRSRFENFASTKQGAFNPITGKDYDEEKPSTRVHAPPGGKSSIQF